MLNDGQEPDLQTVQSKTTVTTVITETLPSDKDKFEPSVADRKDEKGRFQGSHVSRPYKSPDIEGVSLTMDTPGDKERPKDKARSQTTVTTVVTEEDEENEPKRQEDIKRFRGSDFSHPYKSPDIEGISLPINVPKEEPDEDKLRSKPTVTTKVIETAPKEEYEGKFQGSDISHPYKSPDIEGISMYTEPAEDIQLKGSVTVITETVTAEEPNKEVDDIKPKEQKEERGTFKGSDISRPYKTPEFEGISLTTDVPEDDKVKPKTTVTTTVTETILANEEEKGRFHSSEISYPYKSPDVEGISMYTEPAAEDVQPKGSFTVITETVTVKEPNKEVDDVKPKEQKEERGTFKGSDTSRPYKTPEFEGISLATDVPKEEEKLQSKTTVTTTVTDTILPKEEEEGRFRGSDISKPYKPREMEGISLVIGVPKDEENEPAKDIESFSLANDINQKEPEKISVEDVPSKATDIARKDVPSKPIDSKIEDVPSKTVVTDTTPEEEGKKDEDEKPKEKKKDIGTFQGSNISRPYKSPDIEGISPIMDIPQDDNKEPAEDKLRSKTTVTTLITDIVSPTEEDEKSKDDRKPEEKGRFRGSEISHPYKSPDIEGISVYTEPTEDIQLKGSVTVITETVTVEEPNKEVDDIKPKEQKEERGTFKGSDISRPYKTPEFEGISLTTDVPDKKPTEDKIPSETTVTTNATGTTLPTEEEERGIFQGSDISHPYKSPEFEGISLATDIPEDDKIEPKTTVTTTVIETILPREEQKGGFYGSEISNQYKSPDIEGISMYTEPTEDIQPKGNSTVITETVTVEQPNKDTDGMEPKEQKEERGTFKGSDISHPYKTPEIQGISLATNLPEEDQPDDKLCSKKTMTTLVMETTLPKEEEKRGTFKGSDISHPYKSPEVEGISLVTNMPEEDKVEPKTTVTTTVIETISPKQEEKGRFQGSEISHPYKSPDIEGISMYTEPAEDVQPKGTVTVITEMVTVEEPNKEVDDIKPKEKNEGLGRFKGSDISRPYKTPEIQDISLTTDMPEDKVKPKATVTTTVTETISPKEEGKGRFQGSDMSHPYKSPDIKGISLPTDVPKEEPTEDKLRSETTITTTVTEAFLSEDEDEGRFRGSDISRPYRSPETEGISLDSDISKTEEPYEGKLRSGTTVTIVGEKTTKEKTEDIGRFRGSTDISHPYKAPEMEGLTWVTQEKPAEKSDMTVQVTKTTTTTVIEEPADESDEEWFESNEDTTRTDVVTTTEIDEKEKDQPTDVTVTVKKTVTTITDGEPRQRPGKTELELPSKVEVPKAV